MPFERLNRRRLSFRPLSERENRVDIEKDAIGPGDEYAEISGEVRQTVERTAEGIRAAVEHDRPVVMAFGAHTIKNGLGPVLIRLMEDGYLTHLATNGAGIIHDWEFSFFGQSSEHVEKNMHNGCFGMWEETGFYLNLAILVGAWRGLGYGESVGAMIEEGEIKLPDPERLRTDITRGIEEHPAEERVASAADLLRTMERLDLPSGCLAVPHPYKEYSPQAAAFRLDVPFTAHPMIGHDIIYLHPLNHGGAVGRAALRDFRTFASTISEIEGGVYLSVGSAVMSPMIFEKSMSMAQNLALQQGRCVKSHLITVVDLQESTWDWGQGEPPEDHPDYYLRFYKTFQRVGGELHYAQCDNRDFLLALCEELGVEG